MIKTMVWMGNEVKKIIDIAFKKGEGEGRKLSG